MCVYAGRFVELSCLYEFFFLSVRRPPRSTRTDTLFPYTTLFRSHAGRQLEAVIFPVAEGDIGKAIGPQRPAADIFRIQPVTDRQRRRSAAEQIGRAHV